MASHLIEETIETMEPVAEEVTETITGFFAGVFVGLDLTFLLIAIALITLFVMRKRLKGSFKLKDAIIITLIFTLGDYLIHLFELFLPGLETLPDFYFLFKLIALPIVLVVLVNRFKLKLTSVVLCTVAAILLQVRYFLLGIYDATTNLIFIAVHYFLILIAIQLYERRIKRLV